MRRPIRTALTTLGVALGSGLLVALAIVTHAANVGILDRLGQGAPVSAIKVMAAEPRPDQLDSDDFRAASTHDLTDTTLASIRRAPHVTA